MPVAEVGEAVRYRRIPVARLDELAPAVIAAAEAGDSRALELTERLVDEVTLMAVRALCDLDLADRPSVVLLGGGMLRDGRGLLYDRVVEELRRRAPAATPVPVATPPALGAALDALDAAGAAPTAATRLRATFDPSAVVL